jgi:GGDEF domain-containing protein
MALDEVSRDELQGIVTQPNAHSECCFGQWYESKAPEMLHNHPGFIVMTYLDNFKAINDLYRALYAAKAAGKNCVRVWEAAMEGGA